MLMEVLRKLLTGLIVDEVTSSLQRHSALSTSQHGYVPHHGTDTANLKLINSLESAWEGRKPLYGCSWDMSKAFDSVSKPLIVLCWQRNGLPVEIAQWLVDLPSFVLLMLSPNGMLKVLTASVTSHSTPSLAQAMGTSTFPSPGLRCSMFY